MIAPAHRRARIVERAQERDVHSAKRARELARRCRLHDLPGVYQIARHSELLYPVQEERPPLGIVQRLPRIVRQLIDVGFNLREIRLGRSVEREIVRDAPTQIRADVRMIQRISIARTTLRAAGGLCDLGIELQHRAAMQISQTRRVCRTVPETMQPRDSPVPMNRRIRNASRAA